MPAEDARASVGGRRALIVSTSNDPTGGGMERFTSLLEHALGGAGWETSVVSPGAWPSRRVYHAGGLALWRARAAARRTRAMPRPDLIVSNRELGGFLGRLPRIHVYHGTMVGHTLGSAGGLPRRERARRIVGFGAAELLAGLGAVRVGVSESTAEEVHRYYRLDTHRVIPNAVDLDLFKPRDRMQSRRELGLPDGGRYALFVGRADRTKGADVLAPACRAAGWELLVAGCTLDGATSLGVLQPDRLAFAYTAADAVVFPTHYEACSFVVLEALASGTSLVTTEVGWMRTFLRNMPEYRRLTVAPTALDTARGLRAAETIDPGLTVRAREWIERHCALEDFADAWGRLADEVASGSRVRRGVRG